MSDFKVPAPPTGPVPWEKQFALTMLTDMLRIRRMEEKAIELYGQQKIRGFLHLYIGGHLPRAWPCAAARCWHERHHGRAVAVAGTVLL